MRFLADMGVSARVVEWLRGQDHDAVHLRDLGLQRLPDAEVFSLAIREARILLTFDLDFGEILAHSRGSAVGILIFRLHNPRTSRVLERLDAVLRASGSVLEQGAIVVVEDSRHRVRDHWPITP